MSLCKAYIESMTCGVFILPSMVFPKVLAREGTISCWRSTGRALDLVLNEASYQHSRNPQPRSCHSTVKDIACCACIGLIACRRDSCGGEGHFPRC